MCGAIHGGKPMKSEPLVRDLMNHDIQTIAADATIEEAVERLSELDRREPGEAVEAQSLLVVDSEGKLKGLLAMLDILIAIEPPFMREAEHLAALTWDGLFDDLVHQSENRTVAEAMVPVEKLEVVEPDDRLMKVVELMARERQRRLPVVDEGRLIGIVRLYDVFHEVARAMLRRSAGQ
jgi:CBS domain-containing protein